MKKPDLHPVRLEPSLESDLAELVRTDKPYNSREMVPHDIGKLTSEAVVAQYEQAAASVEQLGEAIKESVAKLEAVIADHATDLKLIADAANTIREKGKRVQIQIEEANALTVEIREACASFTKMAGVR